VLLAVLLIAFAIGAAATAEARATQARGSRSLHCITAPRPLVAAISSSLKPRARGRLGRAYAVRSQAQISGPRGFARGAYFVSAYVRGFGIATWAADARAYRTGGGFITGVGVVARRISILGVDIPPSTLAAWGLTERTDGFAASRRCA
jgi:hypothetical protein